MKIGLFFGSFNPIHIGHLIVANSLIQITDLEKVWFVVSPQNPLKKRGNLISEHDRLDLVREAVHDNFDLEVSDVEFSMPKPSFTIDTLAYLSDKYKQHTFTLIVGEDNLGTFHKWKNYQTILEQYEIVVYPRPKSTNNKVEPHPKIHKVNAPMIDISATFIRNCIREGKSVRYLVPHRVLELILSRKLFE